MFVLRIFVFCLLTGFLHRYIMRSFLGGEGGDGAGHQDHQDRTVQYAFIQEPYGSTVGVGSQDHVIPDHDGCQCSCRLGVAQSENNTPLVDRQPEGLLCQPGCRVFCRRSHDDHNHTDLDRFEAGKECPVIDQHPHTQQEEGDKDRVPDKLYTVHQRRTLRDQPVQGQSGKERADDRFHPR